MKQLTIFLLFTCLYLHSQAQTFFKDTTILSLITTYGHEGPDDWGAGFRIQTITLDSSRGDTSFYSYQSLLENLVLTEYDNQLFLSGSLSIHFNYYDTTWHEINDTVLMTNYLLYDFNLVEGDTFWIVDPFGYGFNTSWQRPQDSFLVIESVGKLLLLNGEETDIQILRPNSYSWNPYNCKLLGSSIGALGYLSGFIGNMNGGHSSNTSLITACGNNEELMRPKSGYWSKYYNVDVCNIDSLRNGAKRMAGIHDPLKEPLAIWPNPTTDKLNIDTQSPALYRIINQLGQEVANGVTSKEIDVELLPVGMYYLTLLTGEGRLVQKFVKH